MKIYNEFKFIPSYLKPMRNVRSTHAPISHGYKDAAIDHFLIDHLTKDGWVEVVTPDGKRQRIVPLAHAGNGGAVIDPNGMTTTKGLYACDECAGAMHGANRIGGAMVLSAVVFRTTAGEHAVDAVHVPKASPVGREPDISAFPKDVTDLPLRILKAEKKWVGRHLHRILLPGRQMDTNDFKDALAQKIKTATDFQLKQLYENAKLLVLKQR